MKKKNNELSKKVNTDSVLSTVAECIASTNSSNVAGASALAEIYEGLTQFKIFTGNTGSEAGSKVSFFLPDGWTSDNCWIASLETTISTGETLVWSDVYNTSYGTGSGNLQVRLIDNALQLYLTMDSKELLYNKPFKCVIAHTPT